MMEIIEKRLHALWDNTGLTLIKGSAHVGYYTEIDMLVRAKKFYGDDFVEYTKRTLQPALNVVFPAWRKKRLVLLNGGGFDGPNGAYAPRLPTLNEKDYVVIGQGIKRFLTNTQRRGKRLRKIMRNRVNPSLYVRKEERTPMTGKHLANKHQTDSLPVRFSGKEGTEELCFSLFLYQPLSTTSIVVGAGVRTANPYPAGIVPSGACSMLSAAFLIIFTNT